MSASPEARAGADTAPARATRRAWFGLALLVLPMLMLSTDLTVLFFAMPTISTDLEPTATQSLWIVHAYGFLIAGFLVTAGRLGDRIGSRRLLLAGSSVFAALSAVAAFSTSPETLILLRALMGVAGAALMPSLFSLLREMFPDDGQRRLAIAIMISTFSVGGALGPLIGGALLEFFWWGSVFLINVPPMLLLLALGTRVLPERRDGGSARLDLPSVTLSVVGILALVYGLQEIAAAQEAGGGALLPNLAAVAAGVVLMGLFVRRQRRITDPLFDLRLLADRRVTVSLGTLLLVGVGVVGTFYLFTQYLQWVVGLSPLHAGLWTLPYIVGNIAGALLASAGAARVRPAVVVSGGLALTALGAVLVSVVAGPGTPLGLLVAALSVIGVGQGAAVALISDLIISSAPADRAGSAAAAQEVGGELGTALGIAAGGAVGMVAYRATLPDGVPAGVPESTVDAASSSVHEGVAVAEGLAAHGPALLDAVHDAVGQGLRIYAGLGAVLVAVTTVLVVAVLVRGRADASRAGAGTAEEADPGAGADGTVVEGADVPDVMVRP